MLTLIEDIPVAFGSEARSRASRLIRIKLNCRGLLDKSALSAVPAVLAGWLLWYRRLRRLITPCPSPGLPLD
jgi:hypothetical protein